MNMHGDKPVIASRSQLTVVNESSALTLKRVTSVEEGYSQHFERIMCWILTHCTDKQTER